MPMNVIVMPGDGIGPEVTREGVRVLTAAAEICGFDVALRHFEVGEAAFQESGDFISEDALRACDEGQAAGDTSILFGAVPSEPIGLLRERYDLYANLRPVRSYPGLSAVSPLRQEVIEGTDLLVVRELTSDVYYGRQRQGHGSGGEWASQEMYYDEHQARRIAAVAFEQARRRRKRLTFAHKTNAIGPVFSVWWKVLEPLREQYGDVEFDDFYVDNMAAQLCLRPADFDVILAPNLFGDILSDLAGGLVGSLGLLPSASLNDRGFGLYEPVSGTAPTIAGKNIANPVGSILSVAMMCEHAFGRVDARELIESAVLATIPGRATADISGPGPAVTTAELGKAVADRMREIAAGGK
ncbi:isocitrate/isopropylmalate dehydrogenase family protein [Streptomyces achromogenes]|uniref:isocitrate/isopropylmalate dehydrogenase family protein n=1 Tax=Streptomyces achromogenes TaxID=67255 RepID=UPI0006914FF3|nr:isocitrate/isopropylmalate family dehydrogenase [Streptomyces achromogenes]